MADINPFMGVMLAAIVGVMVWMAWNSHRADERNQGMQDRLIEIQLRNLEAEGERMKRIDQFTALLTEIEESNNKDRDYFQEKLEELDRRDIAQFQKGSGRVDEVLDAVQSTATIINEKLDQILTNQQLRQAVQQGAQ